MAGDLRPVAYKQATEIPVLFVAAACQQDDHVSCERPSDPWRPCLCLCHRKAHLTLTQQEWSRLKKRDEEMVALCRLWLEELIEFGGYERFQSAVHVKRTAKRCLKALNELGLG